MKKDNVALLLGGTAVWAALGTYLLNSATVITAVAVVVLTSLLKKATWSDKVKFGLSTAITLVAGAVTVGVTDGWASLWSTDLPTTWATVLAASQVYYRLVLNGTTVEDVLRDSLVKPKDNEQLGA